MRGKMTLERLNQLRWLNREIEGDKARLLELEALAEGAVGQLTGMPRAEGIPVDKTGRYASEMMDLKQELEEKYDRCWFEYRYLIRYIDTIDDSLTRQVFSLRFINGLSWVQVALHIGGGNTEDGVRKMVYRYISKTNKKAEAAESA